MTKASQVLTSGMQLAPAKKQSEPKPAKKAPAKKATAKKAAARTSS
jgi:hypothetical protein